MPHRSTKQRLSESLESLWKQERRETSHYHSSLNANVLCIIKDQKLGSAGLAAYLHGNPPLNCMLYAKLQDLLYSNFFKPQEIEFIQTVELFCCCFEFFK